MTLRGKILVTGVTFGLCLGGVTHSQQVTVQSRSASITVTEPGKSSLRSFAASADAVLLVHVVAGDVESYDSAVYKAKVLEVFKGRVSKDDLIYFGPFVGTKVGADYVLLVNQGRLAEANGTAKPFGDVQPWRVLREGYGQMEVAYECGYIGSGPCDYAVRVLYGLRHPTGQRANHAFDEA